MWILGCAVALVVVVYLMRAKKLSGIEEMHNSEFYFGGTLVVYREVLQRKTCTLATFMNKLIHDHEFRVFHWAQVGGKTAIVINHPDDIKFMLKDEFNAFMKAKCFIDIFYSLLGDGIFNTNGDKWKEQRITMAHMFNRRQLRDRMSTTFGNHAQEMVQILRDAASSGVPYNIQPLFYCYTFDCINMIAFNRNVNSLKGVEKDCSFQQSFDSVQASVVNRFIAPWWWINSAFGLTQSERDTAEHISRINVYVNEVVDGYYDEEGNIRDDALQGDQTMTGLFLEAAKEEGKKYDRKFLRDMIINVLIAGRDTTGSALTSCVEYLVQHPEWQDKLAEEAKTCFGGNTQEALTFDDIEGKSPVAEAVFLEALRLNPSVPGNEKIAVKDVTFPSGATATKGTYIHWATMATNRRKDYFGEDAEEFNPARWMEGKAYDDYVFPGFNAGPRLCLGKNMAILEGKIALLTIFANFKFTAKPGFKPSLLFSITWQNDSNGMQVAVHEQ
eukprot:TRINITY_DN479_c0_g2_i8.p1 TRINITY_DN479_c0_g2~~TRINITY_DN479_c0_g2_i8.p1  ORF type:complete len:512 (+),score=157.03 TRINITY_DN479_c0_g2_i8:39-1538(+)